MACPSWCKEPNCTATYGSHLRGIAVQTNPSEQTRMERRWEVDMPAYKALRDQGYQPPRIDGSHELAQKAETESDIAVGRVMGKEFHNLKDEVIPITSGE